MPFRPTRWLPVAAAWLLLSLLTLSRALLDAAGNSYAWGRFFGTVTIVGTTLTSQRSYDAFVAKYPPAGTLLRQLSSVGPDDVFDLTVDAADNAYVIGQPTGPVDFGGATLTSTGLGGQGFLGRYSPQGTAAWVRLFGTFTVQRVRTDGNVFVVATLPARSAPAAVQLSDARSRVVRTTAVAAGAVSVQGLYQLRAADGRRQQHSDRLLVE